MLRIIWPGIALLLFFASLCFGSGYLASNQKQEIAIEQQSPDLVQTQQRELDEYTAQIEQQKATLYSYQKASYEMLQEVEALQSRVQQLKMEERVSSKKRKK